MRPRARIIPYYLPQFHPIPENDEWWGRGFTEWTNVAKARPMFKGHYQPRLPADLGYYDLRVPEVREAQAEMARDHGIEGFCYYHYWFGNQNQLLERPLNEVISSSKPNFPFCLCWANESWTGIWFGDDRTLIEQRYGGNEDNRRHFEYLLRAFEDSRYIKIDGKPVFQILTPANLPDAREMTDSLREYAHQYGLKGLYLIAGYRAPEGWNPEDSGFDGVVSSRFSSGLESRRNFLPRWLINRALHTRFLSDSEFLQKRLKRFYRVFDYEEVVEKLRIDKHYDWDYFPVALPNWDNTPRSGLRGYVLTNSTPEKFKRHLAEAIDYVQGYEPDHRIVFVKSWNEWAEGNYLEPDARFGMGYLNAVKECVEA
jgi:hypothetical protein